MALSLDAPIEELKLSKRVRNVLRLSGLDTLRSILEWDYKTPFRGFGPGAREELARALRANGFTPPANLIPSESDDLSEDVTKLFAQMESSFRNWSTRLEHFETRIRELDKRGCDLQRQSLAATNAARDFAARLMALRSTNMLQQPTTLSPEQREVGVSVNQESVPFESPGKPCARGSGALELHRLIPRLHAELQPSRKLYRGAKHDLLERIP